MQGDSGTVSVPRLKQGVFCVAEEAVQLQRDDMLNATEVHQREQLAAARSSVDGLGTTDAFFSDELHQLQTGAPAVSFEPFCLGIQTDATADLFLG